MNLGWKDFYIIITLYIIGILAMFTIIDWTIEKEGTVGVTNALSFFGATLGGVISGGLTLLGVRLTIKEQRRMMLQAKIDKADFIYKRMGYEIGNLNFYIAEFYVPESAYETVTKLINIIYKHSEILRETEFEFFRRIEVIRIDLESIKKALDELDGSNERFVNDGLEMIKLYNDSISKAYKSLKDDYFSKYK